MYVTNKKEALFPIGRNPFGWWEGRYPHLAGMFLPPLPIPGRATPPAGWYFTWGRSNDSTDKSDSIDSSDSSDSGDNSANSANNDSIDICDISDISDIRDI